MLHLLRIVLAGCVIALAIPATALATPVNNSPPTISNYSGNGLGPPAVGNQLYCNPGTWSSSGTGSVYTQSVTWYRDSTSGTQLGTYSYTPVAADIGHVLVCQVTEYDPSDSTAASATAMTAVVLPDPSVTITLYSPTVSGRPVSTLVRRNGCEAVVD